MSGEFSYLPEAGSEKGDLIRGLQLVQSREGYVSDDAIRAVSKHFGVPEAEVEGVLTFYAQFKRNKPGKYKICICDGTACHIKHGFLPNWGSKTVRQRKTDSFPLRSWRVSAAALWLPCFP